MKIKILDKFSYQLSPKTDDMIEVDEHVLKEIGITKCFDVLNNRVIFYDNSEEIANENKQKEILQIKKQLEKYAEDFIQESIGAVIPNIENKKIEFINLHNRLRTLEGKEARVYIKKV